MVVMRAGGSPPTPPGPGMAAPNVKMPTNPAAPGPLNNSLFAGARGATPAPWITAAQTPPNPGFSPPNRGPNGFQRMMTQAKDLYQQKFGSGQPMAPPAAAAAYRAANAPAQAPTQTTAATTQPDVGRVNLNLPNADAIRSGIQSGLSKL